MNIALIGFLSETALQQFIGYLFKYKDLDYELLS